MELDENKKTNIKIEELLTEEIRFILERNQNEQFLRKLLTRALILEQLLR